MNPKKPAMTRPDRDVSGVECLLCAGVCLPVTLAMAPDSPKRVSATCSSAGSKIARMSRNAEGIYTSRVSKAS